MSELFPTHTVSRKTGAALMALLAALLSWCTKSAWTSFVAGALSPEFYPHLFRPLGHLQLGRHRQEPEVSTDFSPAETL